MFFKLELSVLTTKIIMIEINRLIVLREISKPFRHFTEYTLLFLVGGFLLIKLFPEIRPIIVF